MIKPLIYFLLLLTFEVSASGKQPITQVSKKSNDTFVGKRNEATATSCRRRVIIMDMTGTVVEILTPLKRLSRKQISLLPSLKPGVYFVKEETNHQVSSYKISI